MAPNSSETSGGCSGVSNEDIRYQLRILLPPTSSFIRAITKPLQMNPTSLQPVIYMLFLRNSFSRIDWYFCIQNVFLADFKFSDIRPGKLDEKLYCIYPQKILRISEQLQRTISEKIGLRDADKDILRIDFPTLTLK